MAARGTNIKGYVYAALSSSTFGLAPFFTLSLFAAGFSSFEVLAYRWGIASLALALAGAVRREPFGIGRREWGAVFLLSLLRAATSLSLVVAYRHIASGAASTIHFMYPLAVALAMMCFFGEKRSPAVLCAVAVSLLGAGLLSSGETGRGTGEAAVGITAAALSVLFYAGYIVGVRKSRAAGIPSTALTCCVMGLGALFFVTGGLLTGGIRIVTDARTWGDILGLALPATAISNIALVKAIKHIGPTLTSIFGALEPLTAVAIGCAVFHERFTAGSAAGVASILAAVTMVVVHERRANG